jgi:hypothetical protein
VSVAQQSALSVVVILAPPTAMASATTAAPVVIVVVVVGVAAMAVVMEVGMRPIIMDVVMVVRNVVDAYGIDGVVVALPRRPRRREAANRDRDADQ